MLYHVHVEQKIEREQVAKVTGTNKDDSCRSEETCSEKRGSRYIRMIRVLAEAVKNTNSVADVRTKHDDIWRKAR